MIFNNNLNNKILCGNNFIHLFTQVISEEKKSKENKGGFFSFFSSKPKVAEKSTAGKIEGMLLMVFH